MACGGKEDARGVGYAKTLKAAKHYAVENAQSNGDRKCGENGCPQENQVCIYDMDNKVDFEELPTASGSHGSMTVVVAETKGRCKCKKLDNPIPLD